MIDIGMQTALLIYSICFFIGLLFTGYQYIIIENRRKELQFFLNFNFLALVGSLLILFRTDLPIFISVIVSNVFLVSAYVNLLIGIRRLLGKGTNILYYGLFTTLYLILHIYYTYVDFQVLYRVHLYNISISVIIGYSIYSLYTVKMKGKEIMTYVLIFLGISILIRSVNLLINTETSNSFLSFEYDSFFIVILGISNLLVLAGVLSLLNFNRIVDLSESERSKTSLLSNLPGFAYRCLNDEYWTMEFLSKGFEKVTGYKSNDVVDNNLISFEEIIEGEYTREVRDSWNHSISIHERYIGEYKICRKDGQCIWVLEQGIGIYDEQGKCIAIEGFISDINDRKNLEENLNYLSYKDYLTGLYNRRYIEDQLIRLDNSRKLPISIIMGDINGLKFINDSFGHEYGDELIKNVANILRDSLRGYELVARLGGDEFLVVLEDTTNKNTKDVIERIQENIKRSDYYKMGLSVSFGCSTKTSNSEKLSEIVKEAEDTMYKQKHYLNPSSRRKTVDTVLATLFEKDEESENHSRNVSKYSKILAKAHGLSDADIHKTATAGLLHDVGKIIIDTSILKSSEILTDEEFEEIKKHADIGYRILFNVEGLRDIAKIILCHHERPDGKGYPNGLKDDEIPFISKIISICDAYDAMVDKRRYKHPISIEDALGELKKNSGTQFDSELVNTFVKTMTKKTKKS